MNSLKREFADIADKLLNKNESFANVLTEEQNTKVKEIFEKAIESKISP